MILDADVAPIWFPAANLDPLAIGAQRRGRPHPVVDRIAHDLDRHRLGCRRQIARIGRWGRRGLDRGECQDDGDHGKILRCRPNRSRVRPRQLPESKAGSRPSFVLRRRAGASTSRAEGGRSVKGRPYLFLEDQLAQPLMPHATASWLVDNTSLTFQQIATFCGLHILEVQAIADDTAATKLTGRDPLRSGELTLDEIDRGQNDPDYQLRMNREPDQAVRTKGPRYTPVSKRQDKPDGVAWLIRNHPDLTDGQIGKLIGTTRIDHSGDPRAQPLEHRQHPAQGSGHTRPDFAARARRRGRQGRQAGRRRGAARPDLQRRSRGPDRGAACRARCPCPRG